MSGKYGRTQDDKYNNVPYPKLAWGAALKDHNGNVQRAIIACRKSYGSQLDHLEPFRKYDGHEIPTNNDRYIGSKKIETRSLEEW